MGATLGRGTTAKQGTDGNMGAGEQGLEGGLFLPGVQIRVSP